MHEEDKERLLARIAERPITPNRAVLCEYRVYLGDVTDCFTFGGLVIDVCGTGWWHCVPDDNKQPRYSKHGVWHYARGAGEPDGSKPMVEKMLGLDNLHGGYETLLLKDWDVARHYVEQL